MFVMTVERRNLQLLKEFILNGRFSQNIYTCICNLSCIEVNIQDRGEGGRGIGVFDGLCHPRYQTSTQSWSEVITEN